MRCAFLSSAHPPNQHLGCPETRVKPHISHCALGRPAAGQLQAQQVAVTLHLRGPEQGGTRWAGPCWEIPARPTGWSFCMAGLPSMSLSDPPVSADGGGRESPSGSRLLLPPRDSTTVPMRRGTGAPLYPMRALGLASLVRHGHSSGASWADLPSPPQLPSRKAESPDSWTDN